MDDVTGLIESAGGIVLEVDFGCDEASAAFVASLADGRLWFLVNTREHAGERVRLSLAHEIGHAVMHRNLAAQDEARLEQEAYAFAIALLLPLDDFDIHVGPDLTLRRARDLKRAYWVSIQAITRTARDRRLITPERYTSLYKQISSRGWRSVEPEPIPRERPTIWPNALDVHRNRHGYRNEDFARIARLGLTDLQDLFPTTFGPRLRVVPGGLSQGPELRPSEPKRHTA